MAELEAELHPPEPEEAKTPGLFDPETAPPEPEAPSFGVTPDPSVVKGKRSLGDSKEGVYRDLVEGLGWEYAFMSGFRGRAISKEDVAGLDAVIFVATQMKQKVFDRVKGHAKALGVPYRILTFKGNEAFEAAVIQCLDETPAPGSED